MIRKFRWQISAFVLFVVLSAGQLFAIGYDEAYQQYVDSYKKYQQAVKNKLPKADIDKVLADYKNSKAAYELALNGEAKPKADSATSNDSTATTNDNVDKSFTMPTGLSDAQRNLAKLSSELPAQLRAIVEILRKSKSKKQVESAIASIEKALKPNSNSKITALLKYEMASSLDRLDIDPEKAEKLFSELSKDTSNSKIAGWAKLNMNYLTGKKYKIQWNKVMNSKFKTMTDAFNKYKNTSWLAFPVKAARGITYLSKSGSYTKAQNSHEDFLLKFEAAQAPFITNVESVFDKYQDKSTGENTDESARIRLIYNNYHSWYARWKMVSEARSSLDIQYFIIEKDAFGLGLLGLVLKKAREGLKIRLMVDVRGSNKLSMKIMSKGYLEELSKFPNVDVKVYNPIRSNLIGLFSDFRRVMSSNHDKILIADKRFCMVGGRNIADEYLVDAVDDANAWRDTDLLVDSPEICAQLQKAFEEEFNILKAFEVGRSIFGGTGYRTMQMDIGYSAMDSALNLRGAQPLTKAFKSEASTLEKLNEQLSGYKNMRGYPDFELADNSRECPVHILDNNSLSGPRNDITENIVKYIDGCRQEIIIQNPYIVLTPRANAALLRAAKRGVPILVHTNSPQTSDSFPTEAMLYRDWRSILKTMPTMRIFARVNEGQLHGKNFVFDRKIGVVGTYNFDFLSEKINSEVVAVVSSNEFSQELRNEIVFDINKAVEYHLATADKAEFGPGNVDGAKKMWLIKVLSKMGWLKPLL